MILTGLIALFVAIALAARWARADEITWKEFAISAGGTAAVVSLGYLIAMRAQTADVEILSGKVTGKARERVSCNHSYSCNCRNVCSGSGKNRHCSKSCATCYEHSYDIDWNVQTSVGEITIDRVDRRGTYEPPRWTSARIGEPASVAHSYTNWLLAVPDSVFRRSTTEALPAYPGRIFDYYRINRVVSDGVTVPELELRKLNDRISLGLRDLSAAKQVNFVLVLTKRAPAFAQELKAGWLNGKKNDFVLVIGTNDYPRIEWVETFGWSSRDMVNIKVRDDARSYGLVDEQLIDLSLSNIQALWERRPMKTYEYLSREVAPSRTGIVLTVLVGLLAMVGLTAYCIREDIQ